MLDDNFTSQEIIERLREFTAFWKENELFGDYEYDITNMLEAQKAKKEKELTKLSKTVFKYWKSILKGTLRNDWGNAVKEIMEEDQIEYSKDSFDKCMKVFLKETLLTDTSNIILLNLKNKKNL